MKKSYEKCAAKEGGVEVPVVSARAPRRRRESRAQAQRRSRYKRSIT